MDACIKLPYTLVKFLVDTGKSQAGSELVGCYLVSIKPSTRENRKKKEGRNREKDFKREFIKILWHWWHQL